MQLLFTVLVIEGDIRVTGTGSMSIPILSSKSATYMCRLNNEEPVPCE